MNSRTRYAPRTEDFRQIDLATFPKAVLTYGGAGRIRWFREDRETASINYTVSHEGVILSYYVGKAGCRQAIDDFVEFDRVPQPFGGCRKWFLCPGCQKRCRVLYGGTRFQCRACVGATYESQYDRVGLASFNRSLVIREKLGGPFGLDWPFPSKPKGMHWNTYQRLKQNDFSAVRRLELLLAALSDDC